MRAIETAQKYLGETEISGNAGFTQVEFEGKMKLVGWKKGEAWCAYFAELVFKEAYPERAEDFNRLFSASAVKTYSNFLANGYIGKPEPSPGDLVIWRMFKNGSPSWQGHAGIVSDVLGQTLFYSIEGNTNDGGGREGYIVARKVRDTKRKLNGLNVMGFITLEK
jgi:hypothetical protein